MSPLQHIYYGDPGTGKTVLLGTSLLVPELCPCLMLDIEGNTDSIESKIQHVDLKNIGQTFDNKITGYRIRDYKEFEPVANLIVNKKLDFKTIMIDSQSALDYWMMEVILKTSPIKKVEVDVAEMRDWLKINSVTKSFYYPLLQTDYNVLVTCTTYHPFDKTAKDQTVRPNLSGKLRVDLPGMMKAEGYLHVIGGERIMRFQPYGDYSAKDCSENGKLGDKIKNPTMLEIYKRRYQSG